MQICNPSRSTTDHTNPDPADAQKYKNHLPDMFPSSIPASASNLGGVRYT